MDNQTPKTIQRLRALLVLAVALFMAVSVQAQDITLKVNGTAIREVIETLQKNYGYSFSIRTSEVNVNKPVSIDVKNADIKVVLDKIFASGNISYNIDGKLISVTEAAPTKTKKECYSKRSGS